MPLIQLKLGPEKMKLGREKHVLRQVALQVAAAMDWPVERLTVTGEEIPEEDWFHEGGRQPLAMVYWLEGKSLEERQKVMRSVATAMGTVLDIDTQQVNVMVLELKKGSLMTGGRFL
ncbi:tautomerase family protein [Anoxynatronum sibiricum]|uniref:Tautomerase family protein n=1 Tax=Anoxynatronum sibiricum TaxID=210623 RepID=A0ABU9VVR6_9CLOT